MEDDEKYLLTLDGVRRFDSLVDLYRYAVLFESPPWVGCDVHGRATLTRKVPGGESVEG